MISPVNGEPWKGTFLSNAGFGTGPWRGRFFKEINIEAIVPVTKPTKSPSFFQ
jgi:hypothetical protein